MKQLRNTLLFFFIVFFSVAEGTAPRISAYWQGSCFVQQCTRPLISRQIRVIEGDTVYFHAEYVACYGHALLDALIPFYQILKENDLLETPINIVLSLFKVGRFNGTPR